MPAAPTPLERLLRKDEAPVLFGLALLCVLAWFYIVSGAGLGASAWQMTSFVLFPHRYSAQSEAGMAGMAMSVPGGAGTWLLLAGMWLAMMVAMMAPSATPAVLLYARVHDHEIASKGGPRAPVGAFVLGYFLVWSVFSLLAASAQLALEQRGVVSALTMGLQSRWPAGLLLLAAGIYQFTPWKNACLAQCRSPVAFLTRHWRPGVGGALRLGLRHGGYCLGCCWLLMGLLFVGGVMNLAWIAALGVLVLLEKLSGRGRAMGRVVGALMVAWGVATFYA
jgi:predicted metal-binding membrane protein